MSTIDRIPEDALIEEIGTLFDRIRAAEFPRLVIERITDNDEDFDVLRCPRCGSIVDPGDLYAVDFSERWNYADDIDDDSFDHRQVRFYDGDNDDYGDTVYYRHDNHAVSLPEGWKEEWA